MLMVVRSTTSDRPDMDSFSRLMPRPWRMAPAGRKLAVVGLRVGTDTDPGLARAVARLNAILGVEAGVTLPVTFAVAEQRPAWPTLGDDESYQLEIGPDSVNVEAVCHYGALRALSTLAQLVAGTGSLPIGRIEDKPRYPWRGLMLDVARRYLGSPALLRVIDAMAFYKLNVLHLHLSDDQAFRWQSAAYPKLASAECYSGTQLRKVVRRAAERGIRVVPELDMPGHVTSWLAAYPEWAPPLPVGTVGEPGRQAEIGDPGPNGHLSSRARPLPEEGGLAAKTASGGSNHLGTGGDGHPPPLYRASRRFGAHKAVLNVADEAVYKVIDTLLGELAEIFPDPHVHIGGDEVQPAWWMASPAVRAHMSRLGLADAVALQAHFIERVATLAKRHGKRLIGWDEVLNGGAPDGLVVQAWRGATGAGTGHLPPGTAASIRLGYYLDLFFPADVHHAWNPSASERQSSSAGGRAARRPAPGARGGGVAVGPGAWREAGAQVESDNRRQGRLTCPAVVNKRWQRGD